MKSQIAGDQETERREGMRKIEEIIWRLGGRIVTEFKMKDTNL
jgi:hypothetical protein